MKTIIEVTFDENCELTHLKTSGDSWTAGILADTIHELERIHMEETGEYSHVQLLKEKLMKLHKAAGLDTVAIEITSLQNGEQK